MIRLCYVIPSLDIGGTERQLMRLIGGLGPSYEVSILCTTREGALAEEARQRGATVECLGLRGGWDFRLRGQLRKRFTEHRPDVLHTFLSGFDLPANRAARDVGVPAVVSSRRELAAWQKPRHLRMQRKANRLVDAIVANSEAAANYAKEREHVSDALFQVIRNGIVPDEFVSMADPDQVRAEYGVPPDVPVVCTIANMSPVKDYPLFIEACEHMLQRGVAAHVVMVGDGPMREQVYRRIANSPHAECFTHIPRTEFVGDILKIATVSVLTSKQEGSPNAVIEAMAAGRPVVASAVGGIPELIEHEQTGMLIEQRSATAFAHAMHALICGDMDAHGMGHAAQDWVRREMPIDKLVESHKALYADLLARDARSIG